MGKLVLMIHRLVFLLHSRKVPLLPGIINKLFIRLAFGCQLGNGTVFGKNVQLGYGGLGVVIHGRAAIGNNVNIGTNVTIGGTNKHPEVPQIGDNSFIATGAKILGPVKVGKNCVVGANAVLLQDLPDNSLAVGIPAKIVKTNINIQDYL